MVSAYAYTPSALHECVGCPAHGLGFTLGVSGGKAVGNVGTQLTYADVLCGPIEALYTYDVVVLEEVAAEPNAAPAVAQGEAPAPLSAAVPAQAAAVAAGGVDQPSMGPSVAGMQAEHLSVLRGALWALLVLFAWTAVGAGAGALLMRVRHLFVAVGDHSRGSPPVLHSKEGMQMWDSGRVLGAIAVGGTAITLTLIALASRSSQVQTLTFIEHISHGFVHDWYGADMDPRNPANRVCEPTAADPLLRCPASCRTPPPAGAPRVRRAVHTLSAEQWERVVRAMWVMRTVPTPEGVQTYGPFYRDWDFFVLMHGLHSDFIPGGTVDVTAGAAHFATWHAAHVLDFEVSLLAVDPLIEALPHRSMCTWARTAAASREHARRATAEGAEEGAC